MSARPRRRSAATARRAGRGAATRKQGRPRVLSPADTRAIQAALLALYSYRGIDGFRQAVPDIFLELIPAESFSLLDVRIDPERRTVKLLDVWESMPARVGPREADLERQLFDHPFTKHFMKDGSLERALILSDFMTLPQLRQTALYKFGLQPLGVGRVMSIGSQSGPGLATLSVTRSEHAADFSERDRSVLQLMRPHFDQARANLERETLLRASRSRSLKASGLTPRETEVALWLAQGKTNPEIASILSTPVRTIEKHVERVLEKLRVENRAAAAVEIMDIIGA